ncbi:YraN family protein [Candidatus Amesbacteria bacterium]|nr:YraN family protein [Candidatus Amesbacteria bacterium]MBI2587645.1 YraN family protein [Candidatus Amesbacteria bacterium]
MKRLNRDVGRIGEGVAEEYLGEKGYELVIRNFSTRWGEIDLIMRDGERWVFVEVKTKKGWEFGTPEEMFTERKYNQVKRMATGYLASQALLLRSKCRIDMVAVELDGQNVPVAVRHYENVILP